jgi:hypothetical protein
MMKVREKNIFLPLMKIIQAETGGSGPIPATHTSISPADARIVGTGAVLPFFSALFPSGGRAVFTLCAASRKARSSTGRKLMPVLMFFE